MTKTKNPFLETWETPYRIPPFDKIKAEHFSEAAKEAIEMARAEVNTITDNSDFPDFRNTVEALEQSGMKLDDIAAVLFNMNSAETSPEIQAAAKEVSPLLSAWANDISLNRKLFERVKTVFEQQYTGTSLRDEEKMLLKKHYKGFLAGGAGLDNKHRERFRQINQDLSTLTLEFEENVLEETNSFELHLVNDKDLSGLPEGIIDAAAEEAKRRSREGWVFTLQYPSYVPFMQYSDCRKLREKMFRAFSSRAYKSKDHDNRDIIRKIVNLRLEKALLLGYHDYAEFNLEDRMLDTPEKVNSFLEELYSSAIHFARKDIDRIRAYAQSLGHKGDIEKWDWAYFSEKYKKEYYDIDDETLRPYFRLEEVQEAVLGLASSLFGIKFTKRSDLPTYHPEVLSFEVSDYDDKHLAVLMIDYHPRKGKSGGAWMTSYREQYMINEEDNRPLVSMVMNFSKATENRPALLSHSELTTFLHEFGHALHGMLTRCNYSSLSGTSVARDFVELPSQIMENWAYEKEWLDKWARHYETRDKIPSVIIDKIKSSLKFNEGYACLRQLSFGFLDMAWHTLSREYDGNIESFERNAVSKTELFHPVEGSNASCAFSHLFAGGYAAGYYGYKWAELLEADAYSLFEQKGIFDRETARQFRSAILEKGGTQDAMVLYKQFRGKEPDIEALLKKSGFME